MFCPGAEAFGGKSGRDSFRALLKTRIIDESFEIASNRLGITRSQV
jgi:hypothetical protein